MLARTHADRRPFAAGGRTELDQVQDNGARRVGERTQLEGAGQAEAQGPSVGVRLGRGDVAREPTAHRREVGLQRPREAHAEGAVLDPRLEFDRLFPFEDDAGVIVVKTGAGGHGFRRQAIARRERQGDRDRSEARRHELKSHPGLACLHPHGSRCRPAGRARAGAEGRARERCERTANRRGRRR